MERARPSSARNKGPRPAKRGEGGRRPGEGRVLACLLLALFAASAHAQSIVTFAGGGTDDGKLATEVAMFGAAGVALDAAGNIYVTESGSSLLRRIDAKTNVITTIAGNGGAGFSGDGGPARSATLNEPRGLFIDKPTGDIYIADWFNGRVRKINGGKQLDPSVHRERGITRAHHRAPGAALPGAGAAAPRASGSTSQGAGPR